jgi:hypothetical protein
VDPASSSENDCDGIKHDEGNGFVRMSIAGPDTPTGKSTLLLSCDMQEEPTEAEKSNLTKALENCVGPAFPR